MPRKKKYTHIDRVTGIEDRLEETPYHDSVDALAHACTDTINKMIANNPGSEQTAAYLSMLSSQIRLIEQETLQRRTNGGGTRTHDLGPMVRQTVEFTSSDRRNLWPRNEKEPVPLWDRLLLIPALFCLASELVRPVPVGALALRTHPRPLPLYQVLRCPLVPAPASVASDLNFSNLHRPGLLLPPAASDLVV